MKIKDEGYDYVGTVGRTPIEIKEILDLKTKVGDYYKHFIKGDLDVLDKYFSLIYVKK